MALPDSDVDYLLGEADDELVRLAFQHRAWAEQAFSLWRRAGFRRGARLLDLGCGPGFTTLDLAHLTGPEGRVVGVDSSARFLAHLEAQARAQGLAHIETRRGDAQTLELEQGAFDGVYARWLLCFLPRPEEAVARVARALAPGAVFAVTDYFNYRAFTVAPRSAAVDRVVAAVAECWRRRGGDLEVQGRLPALMERCGLAVKDIRCHARVARPGSPLWSWPETFFHNFLPTLLEMELLTSGEARAFEDDWARAARQPGTFVSLPPIYDVLGVRRPPSEP